MNTTEFLTIADICFRFRIVPKTLLRWRRSAAIAFPPPALLGAGSLRWLLSDVELWVGWRTELGAARDAGLDGSHIAQPDYSTSLAVCAAARSKDQR